MPLPFDPNTALSVVLGALSALAGVYLGFTLNRDLQRRQALVPLLYTLRDLREEVTGLTLRQSVGAVHRNSIARLESGLHKALPLYTSRQRRRLDERWEKYRHTVIKEGDAYDPMTNSVDLGTPAEHQQRKNSLLMLISELESSLKIRG